VKDSSWSEVFHAAAVTIGGERSCIWAAVSLSMTFIGPVGDLTSALNFKKVDMSIPNLPSTIPAVQQVIQECVANLAGTTAYTVPTTQTMPTQESGSPTHPSGTC